MYESYTIQYNTIQYNTIQYNTIQYNTIQYSFDVYTGGTMQLKLGITEPPVVKRYQLRKTLKYFEIAYN